MLEDLPLFACGKTSPESSTQATTHSDVFWEDWPEAAVRCNLQTPNGGGRTLVMCADPNGESRGDASMPNISVWPNDASVCSLSRVLETGSVPSRFFLSSKACSGILRRAEKRGKELPPALHAALTGVAGLTQVSTSPTTRGG